MAAIFWQGGMSLLLLQHKHCNLTSLVQTTGTKQDLGKLPFCDISAFQQSRQALTKWYRINSLPYNYTPSYDNVTGYNNHVTRVDIVQVSTRSQT